MAAASLPDRDGAVREVAQVYELIKTHQPLLLLVDADEHSLSTTTLLAQNLLSEALRALNVALSFMNAAAAAAPASIKAEPEALSSSFPANSSGGSAADCKQASMARRTGKRRRTEGGYSWINMTAVPHEDGYQWRKYGEKKIHGTHFTRSYFRCTYKDDKGCQARKQIQQKDNNSESPMFQVTYNNEHTCNYSNKSAATNNNNLALLDYDCNTAAGINCPTKDPAADHASSRMIKQEPQAALITPLAAEVVSDLDQTLWQEAFPDSGVSPYDGTPSTGCTGSCSNVSTLSPCIDELDQMGQTTTTVMDHEAALGDDPSFYDPHLLLLYDSFKLY